MQNNQKYVVGSPFDKAQKIACEFAIRLHEEVIFKNLYDQENMRDAAIEYLLTSPLRSELPN